MKKEKIILRVLVCVFGIFLVSSIVPALLDANNDLAVTIGVVIVVSGIGILWIEQKKIVKWFKNIN